MALLAGIEGKIRAEDAREPGLEGISCDRKGGDMELAFFLLERVDPAGMEVLKEGAAQVNQIKLVVQGVLRCCPKDGQS